MKTKFLIIALAVFAFNKNSNSQTYPDAGMWTTFSLEYPINQKFSLTLDEEFRLKENLTQVNLFYTNLGATYKPFNFLKLGLIYRNVQKFQLDNTISYRNRLMLDITLRKKFELLSLSLRTRFQGEYADYFTTPNGKVPEFYMRNKFEIKYDLPHRVTPFCSAEFRYQIYQRKAPETNGLYHRVRPALGVDYLINKHNTFSIYYLIQHEWNVKEPEQLYIVGLQYSLTL